MNFTLFPDIHITVRIRFDIFPKQQFGKDKYPQIIKDAAGDLFWSLTDHLSILRKGYYENEDEYACTIISDSSNKNESDKLLAELSFYSTGPEQAGI